MPVKPFDPKNEKIEDEKLKEARVQRIFKKERSLIIRRTSVDAVLDGSFVSEDQRIHSEMLTLAEKNSISILKDPTKLNHNDEVKN